MGHLTNSLVHCLKSVRIRTYFGPYFPAFGKIQTKISPNTDTYLIYSHISPYSVWMRENTDQINSEYGPFSRSSSFQPQRHQGSKKPFAFCGCIRESCEFGLPYIVKITNG